MFKLKKYFLLAGGAAFLGFVGIFIYGVYNQDMSKLEEIGERENMILAGFLSDLLETQIKDFITLEKRDTSTLLGSTPRRKTDSILKNYSKNRSILKVKIFAPDGITLYSTNSSEIGANEANTPSIVNATQFQQPTSEMEFKGNFSSLSGTLFNRDIVETYIPIIANEQTIAIVELYSDVTDLVADTKKLLYRDLGLFLLGYLSLFSFLFLLASHADKIIRNQYATLTDANRQLEEAKLNLDNQVAERTRELSDTVNILDLEILERKAAEDQLRQLSQAVEQSPSSIMITDTDGMIQYANPMFTQITGWAVDEVLNQSTKILKSDETNNHIYEEMWETIRSGNVWNGQIYNKKKNGDMYFQNLTISPIVDENGITRNYLSISEDITLHKEQEERIHHLAHHDSLTGLLNRFSLEHRLEQALALTMRQKSQLAVLFIDLDRFKAINDSLGHKAGDHLLIEVAQRLKAICQRKSDIVARIGGDEFVVVLSEINDPSFAALTAKTFVEVLSIPYSYENDELITTPSVGIALYPSDGDNSEGLLKKADTAMYHVKETGRGNFHFYKEQMNQKIEEKILLEKALKEAIQQNLLELYYQPQICVVGKTVCGVEALLRWNHPEMGFISPEKFIPIAEDAGMIEELGLWVIKTALKQLHTWNTKGLPQVRMAINISAKQLESESLVSEVDILLKDLELNPSMVEFEITESTAMTDPMKAIEKLIQLRNLGLELAIDDFGTGYSSLSYLKMLPVQSLKLDKSFVMNLETDGNNKAISQAAISLGHDLGFKVVAEGVETAEQEQFLKSSNCDLLQGYYFSKPQKADEIEKFIKDFITPDD